MIIDNYDKIGAKNEDYNTLRKNVTSTILIAIFQKTTAGSVRGGSGITFDSFAIIDIKRRDDEPIAVMNKSRYRTEKWEYSITDKQIIPG